MSPKQSETANYYLSASELELDSQAWMQPIIIEDEDLTFGGKPLSAWYEEERSRHNSSSSNSSDDGHSHGEEERRGRERVRRHHGSKSSKKPHRK